MSHPNIVKVYDVSFGEKLQYIVMEYVDGITLKEYIQKQGAITWNDALYFTTQILRALQHAHDKGICLDVGMQLQLYMDVTDSGMRYEYKVVRKQNSNPETEEYGCKMVAKKK